MALAILGPRARRSVGSVHRGLFVHVNRVLHQPYDNFVGWGPLAASLIPTSAWKALQTGQVWDVQSRWLQIHELLAMCFTCCFECGNCRAKLLSDRINFHLEYLGHRSIWVSTVVPTSALMDTISEHRVRKASRTSYLLRLTYHLCLWHSGETGADAGPLMLFYLCFLPQKNFQKWPRWFTEEQLSKAITNSCTTAVKSTYF